LTGREPKEHNDLFFLCSLIEYIGRATKNKRTIIVHKIGKEKLQRLFELADVYHCENIDKLTDELVQKYHIPAGDFDNVADCQYRVPTHWDMGKVYKRLIVSVHEQHTQSGESQSLIDTLIEVYHSWIPRKIDDYNCSAYYESPAYLFESYAAGQML
jgi:hypothetical protein